MTGRQIIRSYLTKWNSPRIIAALFTGWTLLAAAGGYFLKELSDKSLSFQEKADEIRDERALAFEAARLNEFWWPVYLRLQLDSTAWVGIASTEPDKQLTLFFPILSTSFYFQTTMRL